MKTRTLTLLAFAFAIAVSSCNKAVDTSQIDKAQWMLGEWTTHIPEGKMVEFWTKQNDTTYKGTGYFILKGDTVPSEIVTIEQKGKALHYIPTLEDQNNGMPIIFTLTESSENKLVFENPKHDFPQKISYSRITTDSIVAEISGNLDGEPTMQQFPMNRSK